MPSPEISRSSEKLPVEGFAILARVVKKNGGFSKAQISLNPGEGALFMEDGEVFVGTKREMLEAKRQPEVNEQIELAVLMSETAGVLMLAQNKTNTVSLLGGKIGGANLRLQLEEGVEYGVVWGRNEQEANRRLEELQLIEARRN